MAKKFAVLHVDKIDLGGIGAHIDRKHTPHNADPERKHLNLELMESRTGSLKKDVDLRISEGYKSSRKIRKDAVKAVGVILSGSPEQMAEIENSGQLQEWYQDNLKFVQERFGEDNILRFTLHMDEKTPHIHCVFTPITQDGRLHYKSFIASKNDLSALQDTYATQMAKYGLKRGLKHTRVSHTTTREFYASIEDVKAPELKKNVLGVVKTGEPERLLEENKRIHEKLINTHKDLVKFAAKASDLARERNDLSRENTELKAQVKTGEDKLMKAAKCLRDILKNPLQAVNLVLSQGREILNLFYPDHTLENWKKEGLRNIDQDKGLQR